jgi:hypothetical protein
MALAQELPALSAEHVGIELVHLREIELLHFHCGLQRLELGNFFAVTTDEPN